MSWIRTRLRADRGDSSLLIIMLAAAVIIAIGIVVDGGGKLRANDTAEYAAQQAARAAGQQINVAAVRDGARPGMSTNAAVAAAQNTLAASGVTGWVSVNGDEVTVTAQTTYKAKILVFLGERNSTATATARIARGVTQEIP